MLDFCFFILFKFRGGVIIWIVLYSSDVLRYSPLMSTILLAKGVKSVGLCGGISQLVSSEHNFPSQSIFIFYNSCIDLMRCSACFFPTYLIPNSSTIRVKDIGIYFGVQSHGMNLTGWYPCFSRCFFNLSCAFLPDCGRPYMTFQISIYNFPLCAISVRLY